MKTIGESGFPIKHTKKIKTESVFKRKFGFELSNSHFQGQKQSVMPNREAAFIRALMLFII